ncbi:MAG: hypothetical protein IKE58_00230 [Blautia sp.]|nr:hypothetical protein [Blautia sp.]
MRDQRVVFISSMIALLPITAFLRFPIVSMGLGMVGLIVLVPWLFRINQGRVPYDTLGKLSGVILFCFYSMTRSTGNMTNLIGFGLLMIWIAGTYDKWIDASLILKIMTYVALAASIIVMLQTICHYLFGFHLIATIPFLIKESSRKQYELAILTGYDFASQLYRPCAFFFEPSHFAQYSIGALLWCLLKEEEKNRIGKAVMISVGIALSTSGMGIAMVGGAWLVYVLLGSNLRDVSNLIKAGILLAIFALALLLLWQLPFFRNAINRVTGREGGLTAVQGRLFWWNYYFSHLSRTQLILGLGYGAETGKYMTGFMEMLYCTGYAGLASFYYMLLHRIRQRSMFSIIFSCFYGVLVIFSGLTTIIHLVFFLTIIFAEDSRIGEGTDDSNIDLQKAADNRRAMT